MKRVQVKKLTRATDSVELWTNEVRNYSNGWVFSANFERSGDTWSDEVESEAIKAVKALNLDFGGVDVIWNRRQGVFVLEVNTACGLEGDTLTCYKEHFEQY